MATSSSEVLAPMLNCGVCRSLYRQPRILSCLHTFCQPCLYHLPIHYDPHDQAFLRCPQCSRHTPLPPEGVADLVHNDLIARMCQEYVSEVQKTLGAGRPLSGGGPSTGQGPASPSSIVGGRSQFGASQGNVSGKSRILEGVQSPKSTSPSQSASFSYDFQRSAAPYSSLASSSADAYQASRRPSLEMIPLRAMKRKLSFTPPEVLRILEGLQRKLNGLQSASVQITYGLENITLTESNWYQRKQDLRREVQRRSAQLQFFIKRQERLLLAMLDSKDTDDNFLRAADQARNELRANLKSVVHETEVIKSVVDLAVDSELLTLGGLMMDSTVSQQPVSMEIPELHFKIPEELSSVEDKMGQDFGCFTSTAVARDIYKPDIIEQGLPQADSDKESKFEEEKEEETWVTETVITSVPAVSVITADLATPDNTRQGNKEEPAPQDKNEEEEKEKERKEEEEEEEKRKEEEEEEEEEEESEEEMIVEETIEIINGKMQVISSRRVPAPKPEKPARSRPAKRKDRHADSRDGTKLTKPEEPKAPSPRGRDPHTRRTVNSSAASLSRTDQPAAASAASSRMTSSVSSLQSDPAPDADATATSLSQISSRRSEASRPTSLNITNSSRHGGRNESDIHPAPTGEREEANQPQEVKDTREPESRTPSEEHQSTLNKFQNFRESLKQRRRELLGASIGPAHLGMTSLLTREKRVHSLDRRSSLRELVYRPPSPESAEGLGSPRNPSAPFPAPFPAPISARAGDGEGVQSSSDSTDPTGTASGTPPASPLSPSERTSRPVRRAVSAASDKATKMEFLRETWKKRKELLIQTDAYITPAPSTEAEEGDHAGVRVGSSLDDPLRSLAPQKARSRITDMSQALTGSSEESEMEPVLPQNTLGARGYAPEDPTAAADSSSEAQAMKTVDMILHKKNVPVVLSPRSPTLSTSPTAHTSPTWPSKPSMVVRPRPRDPPAITAGAAATTTISTAATFIPTPLETLQEDETKASPEQKRGLRATSPSRGEGSKDTLQQVRASIRRKKERWRSLSLT